MHLMKNSKLKRKGIALVLVMFLKILNIPGALTVFFKAKLSYFDKKRKN